MSANFEFLSGLPPEHVTALQTVDLHLGFAPHGSERYDRKVGTYVSVEQDAYGVLKAAVDDLQPDRGDRMAVEAYGYTQPIQEIDIVESHVRRAVRDSRIARGMHYGDFEGNLEESRRAYAGGPFLYAMGHALSKGVPVHHADFSHEQAEAWYESIQNLSRFERLALTGSLDLMTFEARNKAMVGRLGEIAADMVAADPALSLPGVPGEERPVLQFVAGLGHDGDVMHLLRKQNVPFTAFRNGIISPVYFPGVHVIETATEYAVAGLRAPLGLSLRSRLRRKVKS